MLFIGASWVLSPNHVMNVSEEVLQFDKALHSYLCSLVSSSSPSCQLRTDLTLVS